MLFYRVYLNGYFSECQPGMHAFIGRKISHVTHSWLVADVFVHIIGFWGIKKKKKIKASGKTACWANARPKCRHGQLMEQSY